MAALCLPCTAAVVSSAASDSRRINTVYSLPTVYNTCIAYLVQVPIPYRSDSWYVARAWLSRIHVYTVPYTVYALYPLTDSAEGCAL